MKKLFLLIAFATLLPPLAASALTEAPEAAARRYEKDLGFDVQGVSCTQVDTDNDGYVTCSVSIRGGDALKIQSIQCAASDSDGCGRRAEGCKPTVVHIVEAQSP
jgi:hypothetical protein